MTNWEEGGGNPLKVLIIEDSPDDAMLLLRQLRKGGYAPLWRRVETPEALAEALESDHWDIVLSDFNLPAFDGQAALDILNKRGLDLPFIVVSGVLLEETAVDILKAGANDYIKKGNWSRLIPAIDRELREAESRRERRLAQEAREEAEARYRSLFENAVEGIFCSTPAGQFVSVNPAMAHILGYDSPEELILSLGNVREQLYVEPSCQDDLVFQLRSLGSVAGFEAQHYRKDGSKIWVSIHSRALFAPDGGIQCIEGMLVDVTARKHTEEALRFAEEKYRSIFENAIEGIFQSTPAGRFLSANPAMARLLGYASPADLVEGVRDIRRELYLVPEQCDEFIRLLCRDQSVSGFEAQYRRKDERIIWARLQARPVYDGSGELFYIEGTFEDVTSRKQAEEDNARLEEQLRQSQKMEAVGTLAGGIAHDFNNLLQAISGNVEILLMRKKADDPDHAYLVDIDLAIRRAADLVNHLLTFSRKTDVHFQSLNLNGVIEKSLKLLKRTIPRMVSIDARLAPELYDIQADPVQMEQILMNLANNSYVAMPQGGSLIIETENVTLKAGEVNRVLDLAPGEYVLLRVSDTGVGMDGNTALHIFEPFFTTKGVGKGTGLGLSTVYGIVKAHGGHVTCESRLGQGTVIEVYLPSSGGECEVEEEAGNTSTEVEGGTETILVVDDEPFLLDLCREAFEYYGYRVLLAESGEDALEIYDRENGNIDVVILDLGMPGMGGEECMKQLRAKTPNIKIIVASGYAPQTVSGAIHEEGCCTFLGKPYRLEEMLVKVRHVLDGP